MTEPLPPTETGRGLTTDQIIIILGIIVTVAIASGGAGFFLCDYLSKKDDPPSPVDDWCISTPKQEAVLLGRNSVLDAAPRSIVVQLIGVAGATVPEAAFKILDGIGKRNIFGAKTGDEILFSTVYGRTFKSKILKMRESPREEVCVSLPRLER